MKIRRVHSVLILLSLAAMISFSSCSTIRAIKIFRGGKVTEKHFKVQVPFEYKLGLTVIKVKVNGEVYNFALDNGAPNVVTDEYANRVNLKVVLSGEFGDGNGGKDSIDFVKLDEVEIGGIKFKKIGAAIYDMSESNEIPCIGIDGIIGANLMCKAIWQFDFENQIVTITDSRDSLDIPEDAQVIPFLKDFLTSEFGIDIKIGDYTDKNVLVDLGSNGDYSSSAATFDSLQSRSPINNYVRGYGASGSAAFGINNDTIYYAKVPFQVGNDLNKDQIVYFKRKNKSIGMGYFSNYIVTLDWFKDEMILVKKKDYQFDKLTRFPFNPILKDNKLVVGFIFDTPAAKEAGINIDDQIIEMNGKNYENLSNDDYCEFFNSIYEYEEDTLQVKILTQSGEVKDFTFYRTDLFK